MYVRFAVRQHGRQRGSVVQVVDSRDWGGGARASDGGAAVLQWMIDVRRVASMRCSCSGEDVRDGCRAKLLKIALSGLIADTGT